MPQTNEFLKTASIKPQARSIDRTVDFISAASFFSFSLSFTLKPGGDNQGGSVWIKADVWHILHQQGLNTHAWTRHGPESLQVVVDMDPHATADWGFPHFQYTSTQPCTGNCMYEYLFQKISYDEGRERRL